MKKIVVVDFGSQYNQVIVKALRKIEVYSELVFFEDVQDAIDSDVVGIILSGGPSSVYEDDCYQLDLTFLDTKIPVLGVCYGMQYLVHNLGGRVEPSEVKEFGFTNIEVVKPNSLTQGTPLHQSVWMSHSDSVVDLGNNFELLAKTSDHPAIVKHKELEVYGVQFHIEVLHTEFGLKMIENFALNICYAPQEFSMKNYVTELSESIVKTVGNGHVVCALSGGVDSSVVAQLLSKIIPKQVSFFFVDTGLMRKNEGQELFEVFKREHQLEVHSVDAKDEMFEALKGLLDPEDKRKMIGKKFIDFFQGALHQIRSGDKIEFLAQGTLYSDVIESGTKSSHTIKSHHNVGGMPTDIDFKIIEPIRMLFKDEVRELGRVLGLPESIVSRQPFPGPGMGIRVIGEVTPEKVSIVQEADAILREHLDKVALQYNLGQYFCVLTDTKSVGVKGDVRAYEHVLAIRAVESRDFMTADFARIDFNLLATISTAITNKVQGVTRVVYDITSKPPGTIEWE